MILWLPTIIFLIAIIKQLGILRTAKKSESEKFTFLIFNIFVVLGMWNDNVWVKCFFFTVCGLVVVHTYYRK